MKRNLLKAALVSAALVCVGTYASAKTLKASKVDVKAVSKLIDGDYKPKLDKEDQRVSIKSKGTSFVKLNETKQVVTVSSKWPLKSGFSAVDAAVIANKVNSSFSLVQASFREATRDEGETFVLEASLPYMGGLDSANLNYVLSQYVEAAAKLDELLK